MTELELIIDLHRGHLRQGPGSEEETLRALKLTGLKERENLKVADLGCGTGAQTFTLARHINGHITAVDIFPEFLEELNRRAEELGLQDKITTIEASMEELPFGDEEFDLIWSEGAIYNMGFETGLKKWRKFLKPGGFLAVSEITWITESRPKDLEDFWLREYPEIDRASGKIKLLEENGYTLAGYFCLNEESWVQNYYEPLEAGFTDFLERNYHKDLAAKVVQDYQAEIDIYMKYKDYYSYGFYIARKDP